MPELEQSDYIRFAIAGGLWVLMMLCFLAVWWKDRPKKKPPLETPWENGPDISEDDEVWR